MSRMSVTENCGNCRWWQKTSNEEEFGEIQGQCRRGLPQMRGDGCGDWPITVSSLWCYHYKDYAVKSFVDTEGGQSHYAHKPKDAKDDA